ncbi:MAG TPA: ABC transporter ATP-binding protein [Sedimentibacter sp.]|nr:ABC transporter ATP-binding protein [Sedimentibacter sp.]HOH68823.1 ABC transporter ATP-binding protein [Sedimentibacter sp.]HPW99887.1 ABC transporter ATP-binding protein [Sedimentibacter sp.]HQB63117.1 ABC transporter ATP-binding protein [Sedimentibacter sp.]
MNKLSILKINNLTKKYYNKTALENVTLDFEPGRIYGLLGPNGSGKTTFMKVVAGLHKQTSGSVLINNEDLSYKTKAYVSFMPTENYLYDSFKVVDILKFYNDMYDDFRYDYAVNLINAVNVSTSYKITNLSSGQTGKLKTVLALSRDADIYMLDEPLNGVDVLARDTILDIITKSHNENKIMIISTHLVSEIEKILDTVIFLSEGVVELFGDAEELRQERQLSVEGLYKEVFKNA